MSKIIISAALLLVGFFILPNIFNKRETMAFSDEIRLSEAKENYSYKTVSDSVEIVPGKFYKRGKFIEWLLGSTYRELWQKEITVPVLDLSEVHGGLTPVEFSGGQQTIGIEAEDNQGRVWSMRSINKDQAKALPGFWQASLLRPLFRDQASSLNPYGALVVPPLAEAIGIYHSNPQLYFFPYNPEYGKYNDRMAGRVFILEEEPDEGWAGSPRFGSPKEILDTDDMLIKLKSGEISIDTLLYARSRLFDMLISDWDRHEGNWKWALSTDGDQPVIEPIPVDRDMAFYNFGDGIINDAALTFIEKFQSFTPEFGSIKGLMHQSEEMDLMILGQLPKEELVKQAEYIQQQLNDEIITEAFKNYPPNVYSFIGQEHERIFKERLEKLPEAAERFYELIQKQKKD